MAPSLKFTLIAWMVMLVLGVVSTGLTDSARVERVMNNKKLTADKFVNVKR